MAYTYKVNNEKHYIYVQDANAIDVYPISKFVDDLNKVVNMSKPGNAIADFMANALISDVEEYNKFLDMRSALCDQIELMAKLKGNGAPVVYPDPSHFEKRYAEIYKYIADRNLSAIEAKKYTLPFINEYKSTVKMVLEINNETAKKRGLQIEDRTKKNG